MENMTTSPKLLAVDCDSQSDTQSKNNTDVRILSRLRVLRPY